MHGGSEEGVHVLRHSEATIVDPLSQAQCDRKKNQEAVKVSSIKRMEAECSGVSEGVPVACEESPHLLGYLLG